MDEEKVREIQKKEIKNIDPNTIKYMTFEDGSVAIVDSEVENNGNQRKIEYNMINENQNLKNIPLQENNQLIIEEEGENNQIFEIKNIKLKNENNENIENKDIIDNQDNNDRHYENNENENYENENNENIYIENKYINEKNIKNEKCKNENIDDYEHNEKEIMMNDNYNDIRNLNNGNMKYEEIIDDRMDENIKYQNENNKKEVYENEINNNENICINKYSNKNKYENQTNNDINNNNYRNGVEYYENRNINMNNNIHYENTNKNLDMPYEEKEYEKENHQRKINNYKIKEIMVGDRRIEVFDGAGYNSRPDSNYKIINQNKEYKNKKEIQKNIIRNFSILPNDYIGKTNYYNNTLPHDYSEKMIHHNYINNYSEKMNYHNSTLPNDYSEKNIHHNYKRGYLNKNQNSYNKRQMRNQNFDINIYHSPSPSKDNSQKVLKKTKNYVLYSSNSSKSGNDFKKSEKADGKKIDNKKMDNIKIDNKKIYKEDKKVESKNDKKDIISENKNYNVSIKYITTEEIPELLNQNEKINTKVVNAIPLENYVQNKENANQISQQLSNSSNSKIFIATNPKVSNILNQNCIPKPQIVKQDQNLNINNNLNQNLVNNSKENRINDEIENKNYNSQFVKRNNINVLSPKMGYGNSEKQNNINVNVLYHKQGYGNSENNQSQINKKKKKIIYVRRKPIIQQHFDFQIIQREEEMEILQINKQQIKNEYIVPKNSQTDNNENQRNIESKRSIPKKKEENTVPPVQNYFRYHHNFNEHQIRQIYPLQLEPEYNYHSYRRVYNPYPFPYLNHTMPTMPLTQNMDENLENNYKHKTKQTFITLTPMRTINENEPKSPYQQKVEIPYNNNKRYYRNEIYNGFKAVTPDRFNRQYDINNFNEYINNNNYNYNESRRRNEPYHLYQRREMVEPIIMYNNKEPICNCGCEQRQNIIRNNY